MAIGIWAGVSALALAIGPLVGGLLTEHLSWHWIFFVNVPVGALAIAASYLLITESKDETHESLDLPGLATSALGLFALTYGLIEANEYGWTSARIVGSFVVAVVALASFVVIERRRRSPMLDLSLFRSGTYTGANVAMLLVALAMFGVFFFVSLYMQNVLGYSAVQAGAAFLPMTVLIILVAPIAGKLSDKYGSRWLMTSGMVLLGVQLLYLSQLGTDSTLLEPPARLPRRRARDGAGDDADRRGGDARRAGAQVRCRLGRAERDAAGRRLGRHRPDGSDRRPRGRREARRRRLHGRLRAGAHRRGADRVRRLDRRLRARAAGAARGRGCPRWRSPRDPARTGAAAGGGTPAGDRRGRADGLLDRQLQRRHDGADRQGGGNLGADPVPALLVEARPLLRLPRRGVGASAGGFRREARGCGRGFVGAGRLRAAACGETCASCPRPSGPRR